MKTIIIGSGIGGSAIGALLSHEGNQVELYEKNSLIGGRFASYPRDGFRLDVGCHIIANCDRGSMHRVLKIIGKDDAVRWSYTKNPGPVFYFKGERLKFPSQMDRLNLSEEDMGNILILYTDLSGIKESEFDELNKLDMHSFIERYTKSARVKSIFGFLTGMYFVVPYNKTPVGDWIRCQREIQSKRSSGYPIGGTGVIPKAYTDFIKSRGGEVQTNSGIKKILVEDGKANGVVRQDGTVTKSDVVISNADIKTTVSKLVGSELYPKDFIKKIENYKYSSSTFLIKVGVDKIITQDKLIMYIGRDDLEELEKEFLAGCLPEVSPFLMIPVISNLDPSAAPEGRQLIFAGTGVPPNVDIYDCSWEDWTSSCLNALKAALPDIEGHIMWVESTSPKDVDKFLGEDGNVIGISQIVGQVGPDRPPIVDPYIKNLYHCSADTGLIGIGGELAADSALRLYEILKAQ